MKAILLTLMLLFGGTQNTYVYVCTGPYAKRYHKTSTCKGLRNCSESIKKISLKDAVADGKTKCHVCYK